MLTCAQCGNDFPPRPGRGKQSPYCIDCRVQRRRTMTQIRQLRMANTTINEWIEALGPTIIAWKDRLSITQDARCAVCDRRRRLYFGLDASEELTLLCADCHQTWTTERRSNVPHRSA